MQGGAMDFFWQDLRYSLRVLAKGRGFTLLVVFTLVLGIGACSAILTLLRKVIHDPLPYREPARLVRLYENLPQFGWTNFTFSWPDYADFRARNRSFLDIGAYVPGNFNVMVKDQPEMLRGARVSSSFFHVLDVNPQRGRVLSSEDDVGAGSNVVVLSDAVWRRLFAHDPEAVGRVINVNDRSFTVVGVMPPDFKLNNEEEIWTTIGSDNADGRGNHGVTVVGRLMPGVALSTATLDAKLVAAQLEKEYPETNGGESILPVSLSDWLVPAGFRRSLWLLAGAVALLLLVACSNVANLLLTRATERRTEMAVRSALGATPGRLARQLLTESAMLAAISGVLGVLFGAWCIDALKAFGHNRIPRLEHVGLDAGVFSLTMLIALLCGVGFGLAPALRMKRVELISDLKHSDRSGSVGRRKDVLRSVLVIGEVALSLILLSGAGLLIRSYWLAVNVNPGFVAQNVLTARFNVPRSHYPDRKQIGSLLVRLQNRARAIPGVDRVGFTDYAPFHDGSPSIEVYVDPQSPNIANSPASSDYRDVSPGYLEALGVPLLAGRTITMQDSVGVPAVSVVSRGFAQRFFSDGEAVGKEFHPGDPTEKPVTIVGVVGDVAHSNVEEIPNPVVYFSGLQRQGYQAVTFVLRGFVPAGQIASGFREILHAEDPALPLYGVQQMDALISTSLSDSKFNLLLLGSFAGLALLLASSGIFGVVWHSVTQRTKEIGIRMALGAQPSDILRLVIGQSMLPVGSGICIGVVGALWLTRLMSSLLYGIASNDPETFVGVTIAFAILAILACALPAYSATRLNPLDALRW
jgi:putative ABC transport system permease protein